MKVNELRIGNWVECNLGYITLRLRIEEIIKTNNGYAVRMNPNGIHYAEALIDRLNPIPLTEDILTKLGFEKVEYGYIFGSMMLCYGRWLINCPYNYELYVSNKDAEYGIGQSIKYLHQLQNIYFDLIGEELKI